ncbi:MAG: class I SAM-dependent methyltransferase [archaeon]
MVVLGINFSVLGDKKFIHRLFLVTSLSNEKEVIARKFLEITNASKKQSFLDIGCGTGVITSIIAKQVGCVTALDCSSKMLSLVRKKVPNARLIRDDWNYIELKEKFDLILASYLLEYFDVKDKVSVVKKMFDCLNPGGKLVIVMNSGSNQYFHYLTTLFETVKKVPEPHGAANVFAETLKSAGFKLKLFVDTCEFHIPSMVEMMKISELFFEATENQILEAEDDLKEYIEKNMIVNKEVNFECDFGFILIEREK